MQGKQAKIVSPTQERAILGYLATTRSPARDQVMLLLSMNAGLRAKAMASLTWAMVTDAAGQVAEVLHVPHRASQGKPGGRTMPLHPDLQAALVLFQTARADMATPERPIYLAQDGRGFVARGTPHLYDACGAPSLPGRGESPGRAGARGSYQPGDDPALHRAGYRGQAQARRAPVSRLLTLHLCDTHMQQVRV